MASKWYEDGALHFALGFEDTFVPQPGPGERPIDEYELTEHYTRYDEDFRNAARSGAELLRWGLPWYRVNPEPGVWDWDWADRAVDALTTAELRPVLDLLHYGTPLWLDDQFLNPDYPERVGDYAQAVAERYGDRIEDYTPVNEPMIHALFCGEYGYWPPYRSGFEGMCQVALALAKGFVLSQQAVTAALGCRATFVHVDAGMRYASADRDSEHQQTIARLNEQRFLVEDLVTGRVDSAHCLAESLMRHGVSETDLDWFSTYRAMPDVMGVNYYPRQSTELFENGVYHTGGFADPRPSRDDGTEGLVDVLTTWSRRYGVPVMLTETCVTASVAERVAWMRESVSAIESLRDDGLNVVGYTWWPLFDMYEWTYRHTTEPRGSHLLTMGLQDLVETSKGLTRRDNDALLEFQRLAGACTRV
ncbi:family 1 glycosylhydrolase [Actinomyces sp. MRS3W]|uniref:family 1 glycosylhydrolase n=1 Tax=Actinomyces sp. MRS3W TaxID=2800796 RepID=UPI0028FD3CE2|nr:family 1 glycosylhydrolase [Actinomyces sp. MRS3W]MDU0348749.1 family 1 glycosylhydrolase [Actinomyces sp. MRS3W]